VETIYPTRHNLYFWASEDESAVPFRTGYSHAVTAP
jgi:hypothetical protein